MIAVLDPAVGTLIAGVVGAFGLLMGGVYRARTVDRKEIEQTDYQVLLGETRQLREEQRQSNIRELEANRRELNLERQILDLKAEIGDAQKQITEAQAQIETLKKDSAGEIETLKREVTFWRDRATSGGK